MLGLKAVGKLAGGAIKKAAKSTYSQGALKQGVDAFRSFKQKKSPAPAGGMAPAPKKVGSFNTGINTQLKVPSVGGFNKRSKFQDDKLF